jgi:hypothetical protein
VIRAATALLLLAGCAGEVEPPEVEATAAEPRAVAPAGEALTAPGSDPPMLLPRPADAAEAAAEEEGGELIPWARLDTPPSYDRVVPWEEAHLHVGEMLAVEGTIVRTHNSGKACFLNFAEDWKGKFHGVIFASSFDAYPESPDLYLQGKRVRLVGKVEEYRGAPQIVIEEPRQVELLGD